MSKWLYPYATTFHGPLLAQVQVLRNAIAKLSRESPNGDNLAEATPGQTAEAEPSPLVFRLTND